MKISKIKDLIKINLIKTKNYLIGNSLQDWRKINKNFKKPIKKNNKKILIATSAGGLRSQVVLESLIGSALSYKGCDVEFLLCDGSLNACIMATVHNIDEKKYSKNGSKSLCNSCFNISSEFLYKTNLKVNKFSDYLNEKDYREIENFNFENFSFASIKEFVFKDISIGQHAYAGALRYYLKTEIKNESKSKEILKYYFKSAMITTFVIDNLFKEKKFDEIVINHGIYVPMGIINEYARKKKINISTWCPGYRKNSFCFTRGDTYHRSLINENNANWENVIFKENQKKKTIQYLESRWTGKNDWIFLHKNPDFDGLNFFKKNNVDFNKPIIGLATNVMWDAQIDYPENFFSNMLEWLFFTIDHFKKNPQIQLIIRVHPAEVNYTKPARQKVVDEIFKKYNNLPSNIILIPPEMNISTYPIFEKCQSVIIYGTKMGIELAATGKPVIVCGEAFIRNKKIGLDVNSIEDYKNILNNIDKIKSESFDNERSLKYAYHFFFRRTVEIKSLEYKKDKGPNYRISNNLYKYLNDNSDHGLESICNSIINGKDFVFKDENY